MQVTALSFGGGVQTAAMAMMFEHGLLDAPYPDVAVFADTQAEPSHVYETIDYIRPRVSYPIIVATLGDLEEDTWLSLNGQRPSYRGKPGDTLTDLPLHGECGGITRRQCTSNYKIDVIRRAIRQWAGERPPKLQVSQYMGISIDEAHRIKPSGVKYVSNSYPLVDQRLSRQDCLEFLSLNYPDMPVGKSSCFFCPFHSKAEWRDLKARYPELWTRAVEMDDALRSSPMRLSLVHFNTGGLAKWLANDEAQGKLDLWGNECAGVCGV